MPRSSDSQTGRPSELPASLDFDPQNVLERDPYVLLDPRLLAPLLTQFAEEFGPSRAEVAVTQIGALLGLRDALNAVNTTSRLRDRGQTFPTPLRMGCQLRTDAGGTLEIHGHWPDRNEAAARLAAVGARPHGGCQLSLGYTSGWLSGLHDEDLYAIEESCAIDGYGACSFVAQPLEAWRAAPHFTQEALLDALRLPELRAYMQKRTQSGPEAYRDRVSDRVERDDCAVHIWGPVMVIPYAGPEESLAALDLIGRDPGARGVRVVVLDLDGAIMDEAHGALALEHIVHHIETWGAEAILTEPSPISGGVLDGLSHAPLLVAKGLDEAIAEAFRIADQYGRDV